MATESPQPGFGRSPYRGPDRGQFQSRREPFTPASRRSFQRLALRNLDAGTLAQALGWFSIALGSAEVAAPGSICELTGLSSGVSSGMRSRSAVVRGFGVRELAAGLGILTQSNSAPWVWSRVLGDVMDLATLATGLRSSNPRRGRSAMALAAVAGVTALDVLTAIELTRRGGRPLAFFERAAPQTDIVLEKSVAINKPPEECYRFWRSLENLPRFMENLDSVREIDARRSHWVATGPGSMKIEWDSEITEDRPGERLSWRTLDGSNIASAGAVHFTPAPGGRGTIVRVSMHYSPAGGSVSMSLAKLLGQDPELKVREDLRRFKQVMEAGEIPSVRGQSSGRRSLFARTARTAFGGRLSGRFS